MLSILNPEFDEIFTWVIETMIPATDTPGAKDLGVDIIVKKILNDCFEPNVTELVLKGVENVEELSLKNIKKKFVECDQNERLFVLKQIEHSEKQYLSRSGLFNPEILNISQKMEIGQSIQFIALVKYLTVLVYTKSEYVMTNLTNYVESPGSYLGFGDNQLGIH